MYQNSPNYQRSYNYRVTLKAILPLAIGHLSESRFLNSNINCDEYELGATEIQTLILGQLRLLAETNTVNFQQTFSTKMKYSQSFPVWCSLLFGLRSLCMSSTLPIGYLTPAVLYTHDKSEPTSVCDIGPTLRCAKCQV